MFTGGVYMRSIILTVSAGLALAPAVASAAPPARISVGPNVNVSLMLGNQAETTVAVNPTNPDNVVIVSNIQFGNRLFEGFTLDGQHWTSRQIADGTDSLGLACCDPSAAFDEFGNLFLTYLDSKAHDVQLALSTDGGATFGLLKTVEQTNTQGNPEANKWGAPVDQPTVTTGAGSVWVTWKIFSSTKPVQASGAPVTGLGEIGDFIAPEDAPGSKAGSFGDIAVGPEGQVMVTYQDNIPSQGPSNIIVNVDPDGLGPQGFGPAIKVDVTNVGGFDFITPQASRSVDAEFFAAASTNGGLSFSRNVQVSEGTSNAADAHNGVDFGDYSGMAFTHGALYPAWADNSNSTVDNPDGTLTKLDVYTAKVTVS